MQIDTIQIVKMTADDGKVFLRKHDNEIMSSMMYLGKEDSPDNYTEVDAPEPEPEEAA